MQILIDGNYHPTMSHFLETYSETCEFFSHEPFSRMVLMN